MVDRVAGDSKTKMKGALIYAFNNAAIDYWAQAVWAADRVVRHLAIPVTIVTDHASENGRRSNHDSIKMEAISGGSRVYHPQIDNTAHTWFNGNRATSFDITPYDQTLVIDSDYVVASDRLLTLFDCTSSVLIMKNVYDITARDGFRAYQTIGPGTSLHHYWATVMYFQKNLMAQDFFSLVDMIQKNYKHYSQIYGFVSKPYRNDFAVSIALNTLYGHVPSMIPSIPWAMASANNDVWINQISDDRFEIVFDHQGRRKKLPIADQDFHFMNKAALAKLYENTV